MKFFIIIAAITMQMCLGATYSWSVYVGELKSLLNIQQGLAQIPFTLFYTIFPFTVMVAGYFLPKLGPRFNAVCGGLLFGGGWIVASFGADNYLYTCLGIGVLSGIGAGMAYIVPIAVCVRWFPENKGLVTGLAVAGFGGGAALVSKLGGGLMMNGQTPFEVFFLFGTCFAIIAGLAGSMMKFPSQKIDASEQKGSLNLKALFQDPCFQILYLCMFICLAAGFSINANIKEIFRGDNAVTVGITAVAIFALANGFGRILWGAFFDRCQGVVLVLSINIFCQAITMLCIPLLSSSFIGFWALAFLVGFNYGGVLVVYVASVTKLWGERHVSKIYGILFTSNIPAALFPVIVGVSYDLLGSFMPAWYCFCILLCFCSFVLFRSKESFGTKKVSTC